MLRRNESGEKSRPGNSCSRGRTEQHGHRKKTERGESAGSHAGGQPRNRGRVLSGNIVGKARTADRRARFPRQRDAAHHRRAESFAAALARSGVPEPGQRGREQRGRKRAERCALPCAWCPGRKKQGDGQHEREAARTNQAWPGCVWVRTIRNRPGWSDSDRLEPLMPAMASQSQRKPDTKAASRQMASNRRSSRSKCSRAGEACAPA